MKLGATVRGGFPGGGRGPAPGTPNPNAAAATSGEAPRGPRRGAGGPPRDPEYGFRSLGRWGIKNVVANAQIADVIQTNSHNRFVKLLLPG